MNVRCWTIARREGNTHTKKEKVLARNPIDATLPDGLNNETTQEWCLKQVKTYQMQSKIYNEDIAVFCMEAYIQLDLLNP